MKPKFISLKDGRVGLNSPGWCVFIHAFCILLLFAGHWVAYLCAGLIPAAYWIATWINWKAFLKIDHSSGDGHTKEICDLCDPICYAKDGAPLSFKDWCGHVTAHIVGLSAVELARAYQLYLKDPKFRNYPQVK